MSSESGTSTSFHIYQDVYTDHRSTIRAFAREWRTRLQHSDGRNRLSPPLPTHERPFLRKIERWRTHTHMVRVRKRDVDKNSLR